MTTKYQVLLLNGPNLNMLGKREPEIYGSLSLAQLIDEITISAEKFNIEFSHVQSNAEHELINAIHQAHNKIDFILINPAAFTHTSVAIRDALAAVDIPFIEVHLSNVHAREPFRHHSYFSDKAIGVICGLGPQGYQFALSAAHQYLQDNNRQ
ncbi:MULTISPECIES: type II 3-dehydroquinate dehydratase [Thalassotalea]|uniref:type II 3-dehydroquinate dehydratase n=1 Tax=Thalassotalea TaxID=1518149 RepID=UPI000943A5B3|nr:MULTISPECIES: type II 3-dehydroquinate dehydratase [Thalassotalea]OKY27296.1 type II 3-dehydroquinate dehydratase [Thalassotalea sp. PP2-459]